MKHYPILLTLLAWLGGRTLAAEAPDIGVAGQWTPERAWAWYRPLPWLVGCNYLPSTAVNDVEMWRHETFDHQTIDRELAWAEALGFNTMRVFLNFVVWEADADGLKQRFDQFLTLADRHRIRILPILFDDCNFAGRVAVAGPQPDPIPGVHNSQWVSSPPLALVTNRSAWPQLERYVKDFIGTFARDPRVLAWDLYNEPGNSDLGDKSQPLMEAAFAWARAMKPSQPLTVGVCADFNTPFSRRMLVLSDVISFHSYDTLDGVKAKLAVCGEYRRPIFCTEWMARTLGSRFESQLPHFKTNQIACWCWGLVAGRTQTRFPWGSPKDAPEPKLWFHDLLRTNGTPYRVEEVQFIQRTIGRTYLDAGSAQKTTPPPPPPALPDFHADPHIAVFENTYYLYPTTDMPGWKSPSFECWSSRDLKLWKNEGVILHFPRDLKWAKDRAWAPCIASRNGKYYFYYSAEQNIGVAVGDRPTGPFQDPLGRPLIPKDSYQCQVIDPMVFLDDDDSAYLYFGQGNCNVVKLNDDMISFDPAAVKRITPRGYNEGSFVLKRKGLYYLMWSQFDTRDPRYCVSYATSSSPLGPFTNAANNPILVQSGPVKGAGHHSVVQIPGRDEWIIAYHRFHIPDGDGYHRETCLSPMRFNAQGQIEKINAFEAVAALASGGDKLPGLRQLMATPLRDTSIGRGPDGTWYLTGTVQPFFGFNEGIKLWKSKDMKSWEPLGFVWKYGASPWHQPYLAKKMSLWAPEVHYLKDTFWLTYSLPGYDGTGRTSGAGLLRSTTGKPEGPYLDVQPNERLGDEIDASLFQDDDGTVYFLWHSGKIAKLKPDLSGLAEPYHWLKSTASDPNPKHHSSLCPGIFGTNSFDHVGYEGMFICKANGRYYLSCAENFEGRYSCTIATSTHLYGPYGERYEALPHAGHNMFFQDDHGQWWSTFFGSDDQAPWQERPGVLPIVFDAAGRVRPKTP